MEKTSPTEKQMKAVEADAVTRDKIEAIAKPWYPPMLYKKGTKAETKFVGYESIKATLLSPAAATDYTSFIDAAYNAMIATWTHSLPETITFEEKERVVGEIIKRKEATVPLETLNLTFALEGISRQATHQIVRHRMLGYGQTSLRISDARLADIRLPSAIANAKPEMLTRFKALMTRTKEFYADMIDSGIPIEQARVVLPIGTITYIVETGNLRAWLGVWSSRWAAGVQDEHRLITCAELGELRAKQPQLHTFLRKAGAIPDIDALGDKDG